MKRGWQRLLGVAVLVSGVACGSDSLTGPSAAELSGPYMLSGTVSQESPGGWEPSRGAHVLAVFGAGERSAATDEGGKFLISGLPAGTASIYVTRIGYGQASARVNLTGDLVLDIQLRRQEQEPGVPKVI